MSTLPAVNAFVGKVEAPSEAELAAEIGTSAKALWDRLVAEIGEETGANTHEWNSYSPKAGWSLRLKRQKRNIMYLVPQRGGFEVAFVLGEKAINAAHEAGLPSKVLKIIESAPKYAEGTGFRLEVERVSDLLVIRKLASIKVKN